MKYVQINRDVEAWARSIVLGTHRKLQEEGHTSYVFWGRGNGVEDEWCRRFATDFDVYADALMTRFDGKPCFHSKRSTAKLLSWLDEIDPDVVHLHNLLGYYINIDSLFNWLASHRCKVVWTLHDCWALTGHCIHFTYAKCSQWKNHCGKLEKCPQPDAYPETFRCGMESWNHDQKKKLFTLLPADRMRLITPSQWLADLVKQSYLAKYDIEVVHNTVDAAIFKPTQGSFREQHGIGNRFLILGVASKWSEHKGLEDFVSLSEELDSSRFAIVLLGLSEKQIRTMPKNIVGLPRTSTVGQLAEAYTAADVLYNPTLEDNFPTVNLEAEACGTDVITYNTGGCAETISRPGSSVVHSCEEARQVIVEREASCNRKTV